MPDVLVDTNILLDLLTQDPVWEARSTAALAAVAEESTLVINPIIYAELSVGVTKIEELDEFLGTDFRRDPLPWDAAFLAGKAFLAYRKRSGIKTAPLPDFYIGAHAAVQQMEVLTRDPRRYKAYFPMVSLIEL
jgi:predicted nucleic acid-binding protein